jgi:putative transposase
VIRNAPESVTIWSQTCQSLSAPVLSEPIERFNRTFREEVLGAYLFDSLDQEREITDAWLATYNTERPHDSLDQVPPLTFLPRSDAPAQSTFEVST